MKKNLYIWGILLLGVILYGSCVDDDVFQKRNNVSAYLSIAEARKFFENSFAAGQTRSDMPEKDNGKFSPGDFTPQWSSAQPSQDKNVGSVDVPLVCEYRYKAVRCDFKHEYSKVYVADVTQKLVIVKSKHTGKVCQYILSLVPDQEYYRKNKGNLSDKFIHSGDKGGYSGLAIYSHLQTGRIISVSKYQSGDLLTNVYLPTGEGSLDLRVERANVLLEGFKVPRVKTLTTRSFGEEDEPMTLYCSFCGQDVNACDCWSVTEECRCGNCELCGFVCVWCGHNPCTCADDLTCPVCGYENCICNNSNVCVYCGDENCSGECQDRGETPPVNEEPEPKKITAKDLFGSSGETDENRQKLEKMLEKIMENCMGQHLIEELYEALDGSTLGFELRDGGGGAFNYETDNISIGTDNIESNVLFHEMWHAYQFKQETQSSYVNSFLNQEIESHYAQYLYLKSMFGFSGSKWEDNYVIDERLRGISVLQDFIDSKGFLLNDVYIDLFDVYISETLVPIFKRTEGYEEYLYDKNRDIMVNFTNLQLLTKDC